MTNIPNEVAQGWGAVGAEESNQGEQKEKLEFLKIPFGDTKIRILDVAPLPYKEWWAVKGNEGKGCSIPYFKQGDLLDQANKAFMAKMFKEADNKGLKDKARKDFLRDHGYKKTPFGKVKEKNIIHILDRATGEIKLLDAGNGIFNAIKKFALNADYGDPRFYDITITKEDTKGQGNFQDIKYSVLPSPNKAPITDKEKELYDEKKIDLVEYKTPSMTPAQALLIAKGASFTEVLGSGSDSPESVEEKSDANMLPDEETTPETTSEQSQVDNSQEVDVNKEEALSEEELANISFD
jgi:hypothetical protein